LIKKPIIVNKESLQYGFKKQYFRPPNKSFQAYKNFIKSMNADATSDMIEAQWKTAWRELYANV